ncbi:hypothetical protein SVIOM342S_05593 [Streptomyces violaceorubidus]
MVTDCLVDARPIDGEFRVVRPDGAVRTVHMMGEPVLDADGSTASMWAVLRDVSELRRSQRAVSETHDWLRYPPPPPWHGLLRFPEAGRPGLDLAAVHLPPTSATGRRSGCEAWYDACPLGAGDETLLTVGDFGRPETEAHGPTVLIGALRGLALAGTRPTSLPNRLAQLLRGHRAAAGARRPVLRLPAGPSPPDIGPRRRPRPTALPRRNGARADRTGRTVRAGRGDS